MELDGETHTSAHSSWIYIFLSYFEEKRTITERERCTGKLLTRTDTQTDTRMNTHGRTHTFSFSQWVWTSDYDSGFAAIIIIIMVTKIFHYFRKYASYTWQTWQTRILTTHQSASIVTMVLLVTSHNICGCQNGLGPHVYPDLQYKEWKQGDATSFTVPIIQ